MEEAFEAPDTIRRMPITAWGLLYSLKPEQRRQCEFAMTDPGRLDWDFIPKPDRQGIPLAQLDSHQRTLAQSMLAAGLSVRGYSQALQIMAMENMLREIEAGRTGVVAGRPRAITWRRACGRRCRTTEKAGPGEPG